MSVELIIVGVDGSPRSLDALDHAVREARLRGCAVEVVTAVPETGDDHGYEDADRAQQHAMHRLEPTVGAVPVAWRIVRGRAEDVLVEASERASLLVIGGHGVWSMRHAMVDAIGDLVSRMACCPVLIVPAGVTGPPLPRAEVEAGRPAGSSVP